MNAGMEVARSQRARARGKLKLKWKMNRNQTNFDWHLVTIIHHTHTHTAHAQAHAHHEYYTLYMYIHFSFCTHHMHAHKTKNIARSHSHNKKHIKQQTGHRRLATDDTDTDAESGPEPTLSNKQQQQPTWAVWYVRHALALQPPMRDAIISNVNKNTNAVFHANSKPQTANRSKPKSEVRSMLGLRSMLIPATSHSTLIWQSPMWTAGCNMMKLIPRNTSGSWLLFCVSISARTYAKCCPWPR